MDVVDLVQSALAIMFPFHVAVHAYAARECEKAPVYEESDFGINGLQDENVLVLHHK